MQGFIEEGVATAGDFRSVHAPMGVPIRSLTVEEIAVSIVAELVAVRRGKLDTPSLSATGELAAKLDEARSPSAARANVPSARP